MTSFKMYFTLDPTKVIRKTAEPFVAIFPLDLIAKKEKLAMNLTKQK